MKVTFPYYTRIGSPIDLNEKRRRVALFHYLEMELMEILAGWSESMIHPHLRSALGIQIWEHAQTCDRLAWALVNLKKMRTERCSAPNDEFVRLCERIYGITSLRLRLVGTHQVLLSLLDCGYVSYLEQTDGLSDAHTVEVISQRRERIAHQTEWAQRVIESLTTTPAEFQENEAWRVELCTAFHAVGGLVGESASAIWMPFTTSLDRASFQTERPERVKELGYTYNKTPEFEEALGIAWDDRFHYATHVSEMPDAAKPGSRESALQFFHLLFHGENTVTARMGWILVDFPDLPWAMRYEVARQMGEEARHISIVAQIFERLGGELGMYPFSPYFGQMRRHNHNVVAHLISGNVVGETWVSNETNRIVSECKDICDRTIIHATEHLNGDEMFHIRLGAQWPKLLVRQRGQSYYHACMDKAIEDSNAMHAAYHTWGGSGELYYADRNRIRMEMEKLTPCER